MLVVRQPARTGEPEMPDDRDPDEQIDNRDGGVARRERRERKKRRRMPIHGRSLEAVMNAIRKRAKRQRDRPDPPR